MRELVLLACDRKYRQVLLAEGTYGVHSVYRNTVNVKAAGMLMTFQPAFLPHTPLSAVVGCSAEQFHELTEGQTEIRTCDDCIYFGSSAIRFSGTEFYSSRYDSCFMNDIHELSGEIREYLTEQEKESFFHALSSEKADFSSRFSGIREAHGLLMEADSYRDLAELIGLGQGLTPSGDDFLIGAMLGLLVKGNRTGFEELSAAVRNRTGKTNDISAAFLQCACNREFSAPLLKLTRDVDTREILRRRIREVGQVGHSSGNDTLAGMLWILEQSKPLVN